MPQIDAFPYLTPDSVCVQSEDWYLGEPGLERTLPPLLKDWDPLTDLFFARTLTLDFPGIFQQCGLSSCAEIAVTASWHSPGTGLREQASAFHFSHGASRHPINFALRVTGSKLAGGIELITRAALRRRGKADSPLAATRPGSILWQDTHLMKIEGFGSRFPMEFADFSEAGYSPGAGWRLFWRKDFHAQAMGGVCLMINRQHERLRSIVSGAIHDPQSPAILESIHFSVAREMIVGALTDDAFIEEMADFPKGSIGEAVRLLVRRVFGNEEPEAVRQMLQNEPDRFDCHLQHALRLFQPPAK